MIVICKKQITDEIIKATGNENVIVHQLDLNSFKSIREFAANINDTETRLDCLVHNAGYAQYFKKEVSVDGIEMTMATNHYGPFLLTHLLIDLMKKTAKTSPCRIVVVSSITHSLSFFNPTKPYHLNPLNFFMPIWLYNNTKFANILFTFELANRLQGTNITANCLHPGKLYKCQLYRSTIHKTHQLGVIDTDIWRNMPMPLSFFFNMLRNNFLKTIEEGIQTTLYAMMSPELENVTGQYLFECKIGEPRSDVYKRDWQSELWKASQAMVKLTENDSKI